MAHKISLLILTIILSLVVITFLWFLDSTRDLKNFYVLFTGAIVTLLATSAGISVPLIYNFFARKNEQQEKEKGKKKENRRILAFSLGLIWNELCINRQYLKDIKNNYKNDFNYNTRKDTLILGLWHITKALKELSKHLDESSYIAAQSSGAIRAIDNDNLFNALLKAYEDINYFKFQISINLENLTMQKFALEKGFLENNNSDDTNHIKAVLKLNHDKGFSDLKKAIDSVHAAISIVDTRLNELGVYSEEKFHN